MLQKKHLNRLIEFRQTKVFKTILSGLLGFTFCISAFSNNSILSNISLTEQVPSSDYTIIKFDLSWENSWRTSTLESNWDAVWIFSKWRLKNTLVWNHCTIHSTGHTAPSGSVISPSADGLGTFIYKDSDGIGNNSWTNVKLRWNYGVDGIQDNDSVEICVFGIEMVYIPTGSFYLGDGGINLGQFHDAGGTTPFSVSSENAITLGGSAGGNLGDQNSLGMIYPEDFDSFTTQTLPSEFPKGYAAFYSMKYELSQIQYVEFLNKLTYTQQVSRTTSAPNSISGTAASSNSYRNGLVIDVSGVSTTVPAVYACNLDGDGTFDEPEDGKDIACNWISWADLSAFLDWSGLRPFTELEFEKMCRGDYLSANAGEYAWGNLEIIAATGISNSGQANETALNLTANCAFSDQLSVQGPLRVGSFAQSGSSRTNSGGSYYGVLDLSGNLWERMICVGNTTSRAFTGLHGNGALDVSGNNDVVNWPGSNAIGTGIRGGSWYNYDLDNQMSNREWSGVDLDFTDSSFGGRGVRTAP